MTIYVLLVFSYVTWFAHVTHSCWIIYTGGCDDFCLNCSTLVTNIITFLTFFFFNTIREMLFFWCVFLCKSEANLKSFRSSLKSSLNSMMETRVRLKQTSLYEGSSDHVYEGNFFIAVGWKGCRREGRDEIIIQNWNNITHIWIVFLERHSLSLHFFVHMKSGKVQS